jgi:hypothetical protein
MFLPEARLPRQQQQQQLQPALLQMAFNVNA